MGVSGHTMKGGWRRGCGEWVKGGVGRGGWRRGAVVSG